MKPLESQVDQYKTIGEYSCIVFWAVSLQNSTSSLISNGLGNFRNIYERKPLEIIYIVIPVNILFKNFQVSKDEVFVATTYTAREYTDQFGQLNFIITMRSLKVKIVVIFFWPMPIHLLIFLQLTYIFLCFLANLWGSCKIFCYLWELFDS